MNRCHGQVNQSYPPQYGKCQTHTDGEPCSWNAQHFPNKKSPRNPLILKAPCKEVIEETPHGTIVGCIHTIQHICSLKKETYGAKRKRLKFNNVEKYLKDELDKDIWRKTIDITDYIHHKDDIIRFCKKQELYPVSIEQIKDKWILKL